MIQKTEKPLSAYGKLLFLNLMQDHLENLCDGDHFSLNIGPTGPSFQGKWALLQMFFEWFVVELWNCSFRYTPRSLISDYLWWRSFGHLVMWSSSSFTDQDYYPTCFFQSRPDIKFRYNTFNILSYIMRSTSGGDHF